MVLVVLDENIVTVCIRVEVFNYSCVMNKLSMSKPRCVSAPCSSCSSSYA